MGLTITKHREHVDVAAFELYYAIDSSGGFGFPCNEEGVVDVPTLSKAALENYQLCLSGIYGLPTIKDVSYIDHLAAEGKCICGKTLTLCGDQECLCGRMYNISGQQLTRMSYIDPSEDY